MSDVIQDAIVRAESVIAAAMNTVKEPLVEHAAEINTVYNLLCDEASRTQYYKELSFLLIRPINLDYAVAAGPYRLQDMKAAQDRWNEMSRRPDSKLPKTMHCDAMETTYLVNMLLTTFINEQYKYAPHVMVEPGDIFIDCGACFGDTSLWAYQEGAKEVYSFEPSPDNFLSLKINMEQFGYDPNRCFPYAVGDKDEDLHFAAAPGMAGSCNVNANGNVVVHSVKLDDFLKERNIKPTFLKFDIEGAEMGALRGLRETITTFKPKLAVSLYHKLSDMWEVPLLIKEMVPEYKFYCRKNHIKNEFILYAAVE
ncbi:MAG: FkbM family methyltransferase [Candidatus Anaerobiospirillum pullicola]|uniref:FkbM family methyltransferase n=1 Tax=Candidatus Anaerobiospirillum pullicola TaxID=2838451 RepID=A0A948X1L8_9GAMM|nr:FkbM family methyltransferase [Candidatus Anaerobiospirillum pullicola]